MKKLAILAILIIGLLMAPIEAAKPQPPTMTITPDVVAVSQVFLVEGEGFAKKTAIFIIATSQSVSFSTLTESTRQGGYSVNWAINQSGVYFVHVCQLVKRRDGFWQCGVAPVSLTVN